jgi:mercuric ion transport protein
VPSAAKKSAFAGVAGVTAAAGSALCCAGPLVAVYLGVSGAGLAAAFTPLRPYLIVATVLALGFGFLTLRREERKACEPGRPCASPAARRRMKRWLLLATLVAVPFLTFPWWSRLVLD